MVKIRSKYTHSDFQFARFILGTFEFGIEVRKVKEIVRYRGMVKTPATPPFLEGFINLRNIAVPVVDLRKRFSLPAAVFEPVRIIIVSVGGRIAGFVVDSVKDIAIGGKEVRISPKASKEPWDGCVEATVETGKGIIQILSPTAIFSDDERRALDAPMPSY